MTAKRKIAKGILAVLTMVAVLTGTALGQTAPDSIPRPQLGPNDTIPVPAMVIDREYVPAQTLENTWVMAPYPKNLLKRRQEWTRLRNAIYVTYP